MFVQNATTSQKYRLASAAGRYLVLCFLGGATNPAAAAALAAVQARPDLFNDTHASFFGVTVDPDDQRLQRVTSRIPGIRHFWDFNFSASTLYGAAPAQPVTGPLRYTQQWVVIDPELRIIATLPFDSEGRHLTAIIELVSALPAPHVHTGQEIMAPVLYLPRVFEPDLCDRLMHVYDTQGGQDSGFMREVGGRTVGVSDHSFKSRKDCVLSDQDLISAAQDRIRRRIVPQIAKAHQFHVTRMERYIVACYAAEDGGHFAAHRDNTTAGTAHRRFAVSINLNDDFDGGEVSFPEYGPRSFKAPAGGAVVFSCSLLHRVSRVEHGRRYAFLPFLYDEAAAQIRTRNASLIGEAEVRPDPTAA
ncbi:hypothetical protein GCM10011360_31700 [Primorskyibacter flagellatus]|uniref:Fe2OG dioxygenase domain-containing protein n=2 Tax=Primorskyibacter flagellatus TaxID=1387277 RepID=A0A917AC53_9RHOB|nr:hypothetical protein GCM10011360_31700 [Primorskyibacter flagellatus]